MDFEIINLGGDEPHKLIDFLKIIEKKLNKKAKVVHKPFHPTDLEATWADITKAKKILGWRPKTKIEKDLENSIAWFKDNRTWAVKVRF